MWIWEFGAFYKYTINRKHWENAMFLHEICKVIKKFTLELNVLTLSWNRSSCKVCQGIWMTGRWLETDNIASQRVNRVWLMMSFNDVVTALMGKGRATDNIDLDFCETSNIIPHIIIFAKLVRERQSCKCPIRWSVQGHVGWNIQQPERSLPTAEKLEIDDVQRFLLALIILWCWNSMILCSNRAL